MNKSPGGAARPYLSVCACCGYDVPYLIEWIEFHRLVGVQRFLLYNNGDRDRQRELLAPYVDDGVVVLHEWLPFPPQVAAYDHCIEQHRGDSRWIAFIDTDEFLFSPTGEQLDDVLRDYERWAAVGACRAFFGPSGHRTKPPGLVTDSYRMRFKYHGAEAAVKSIVDPRMVERTRNPHCFDYRDGLAVDEKMRPLEPLLPDPRANDARSARARRNPPLCGAPSLTYERLRINHYWTRSEAEALAKFSRRRPDTGDAYLPDRTNPENIANWETWMGAEHDDTIMAYVPALRAAVEARRKAAAGRLPRAGAPTDTHPLGG